MSDYNDIELKLINAEKKAIQLFNDVESNKLIQPGLTEKQVNQSIYDLAETLFGIKKYWHKRIVRAGKNTIHPYQENPMDVVIENTDIVFLDFGPIFESFEADYGKTYTLGNDAKLLKLKNDSQEFWNLGQDYFFTHPNCTASELYHFVYQLAIENGYVWNQEHCGHLIGKFPHEKISTDKVLNYLHPHNHDPILKKKNLLEHHYWILEIFILDSTIQRGAFHEQILNIKYI